MKLEWHDNPIKSLAARGDQYALTPFGRYMIKPYGDARCVAYSCAISDNIAEGLREEELKQAAQDHFDRSLAELDDIRMNGS